MSGGGLFDNLFMAACVALGSTLILHDLGVVLGTEGAIGLGVISAALGITLAAIANRGEGR
jgi:hypothetical protein